MTPRWRLLAILVLIMVFALASNGCAITGRITGSTFHLRGDIMAPTLEDGTTITIDKNAYKNRLPERGDIIVFAKFDLNYVNRVIGLPGEHMEVKGGLVYVNGVKLDEPYLQQGASTQPEGDYLVPDGHFFTLGDNRGKASPHDSQTIGFVTLDEIKGKVKL